MRIVTSLSPHRVERQQRCIKSWHRVGAEVIAVQSPGETDVFSSYFPDITFAETHLVGDLFGRPKTVRIRALIDHAPCILVNSDIEIVVTPELFRDTWDRPVERTLQLGIRWDYHERTKRRQMIKWGIDVFRITEDMMDIIPDIGMSVGVPVWDFWLPWYLHKQGYAIKPIKTFQFEHVMHKQHWAQTESVKGYEILKEHYGITQGQIGAFVLESTGRKHVKQWRPAI